MRLALMLLCILFLPGCAAWTAYTNRDASENEVQLHVGEQGATRRAGPHQFSALAFTASRRAITVSTNTTKHPGKIMFCAEPPPDAASSILASDTANIGLARGASEEVKLALASTYAQAATSIAARSPLVEIYRSSVYTLCQMYANGALTEEQVYTLFLGMTKDVVAKMDGTIKPVVPPAPPWNFPPCDKAQDGVPCLKEAEKPKKPEDGTKPGAKVADAQTTKSAAGATVTATATASATVPAPASTATSTQLPGAAPVITAKSK